MANYFLMNNFRLTSGPIVCEFEKKWPELLGLKYFLFVNSDSPANFMIMAGMREIYTKAK